MGNNRAKYQPFQSKLSQRLPEASSIKSALHVYGTLSSKKKSENLHHREHSAYRTTPMVIEDSSSANRSYLIRKQKELDKDGELISNRVNKLRLIEKKMLKKIDKTR